MSPQWGLGSTLGSRLTLEWMFLQFNLKQTMAARRHQSSFGTPRQNLKNGPIRNALLFTGPFCLAGKLFGTEARKHPSLSSTVFIVMDLNVFPVCYWPVAGELARGWIHIGILLVHGFVWNRGIQKTFFFLSRPGTRLVHNLNGRLLWQAQTVQLTLPSL